jgi:putative DNA primase/helicase
MGKSQAAISIAAILSSGGVWPTGETAEPGATLILEPEDDLARTVTPRLIAAGADLKRVGVGKLVDLSRGPELLEAEWKRRKGLRLVVLSPIRKFVGGAEAHGNLGIRDVLQPVLDWAERRRVALLGIAHPPKGEEHREAFAGSAAFLELARAAFSVIPDPASDEPITKRKPRLLVGAKANLAADDVRLSYRIESAMAGAIPSSRVVWGK